VVAIIVYRLAVFFSFSTRLQSDLKELEPFKEYVTAQMATSVTASIISFVVIMVLNILYERVAIWITDFGETPQCQTMSNRKYVVCYTELCCFSNRFQTRANIHSNMP
jgi:anoctamin-6